MALVYNSVEELLKEISKIRKDKKIVFTNGCFDILHPGHVYILEKASLLGDILVVGLNDDDSVKKIKGKDRPVLKQQARAKILSVLEMIDYVVLFSEETPYHVIERLKPDVLVKGSEYTEGEVVGEDIAGETVRIEMKPEYSTSEIIEKIWRMKN